MVFASLVFQRRLLPAFRASCRAMSQQAVIDNASRSIAEVQEVFRQSQAVCFDVDSTVIQEEAIDVLADYCGKGRAVADLTAKAMGGSVLFQDALRMRLDLIQPSKSDFSNCMRDRPFQFTNGVQKLVSLLQTRGKHVYLVSGGFRLMIEPIAETLAIPKHRIFANTVLFNDDDTYLSFDATEPTSRDRGKPAVIQSLMQTHGYSSVVMIGDGATDMQARPPAQAFIGFGGVVRRKPVEEGADWFITNFDDLIKLLE